MPPKSLAQLVVLPLLFTLPALFLSGQEKAPATGQTSDREALAVIEKALQVFGGAEGYKNAFDFLVVYQAHPLPKKSDSAAAFEWTILGRSDGCFRVDKKIDAEVESYGFDGKDFWRVPAKNEKPVPPKGAALEAMKLEKQACQFLVRYEALGYVAQSSRPEAGVAGQKKVTFVRKEALDEKRGEKPGDVVQYWFDPYEEGYLPSRMSLKLPSPSGKTVQASTRFDDYRKVNGVPVAHKLIVSSDERPILEAIIKKIEVAKRSPDDAFKGDAIKGDASKGK